MNPQRSNENDPDAPGRTPTPLSANKAVTSAYPMPDSATTATALDEAARERARYPQHLPRMRTAAAIT